LGRALEKAHDARSAKIAARFGHVVVGYSRPVAEKERSFGQKRMDVTIRRLAPTVSVKGYWRMNSSYRDWRDYQEAVAAFFRARGCAAAVEERVTGARASHTVDVYVTFRHHGMECRWIVECKLWQGRVGKQEILTLKGVVEDIGADRGIIFCETGFQTGARDAARHSNLVLVTSLDEFRRTAEVNDYRINLVRREGSQPGAPPVYAFPGGDQPQRLLAYCAKIFVANWKTGNIAIVDPAAKLIDSVIQLDKYESISRPGGARAIRQYPPGDMACADGKLFVGQVFSEFILVIDIATQSIVKRIMVPVSGEGAMTSSPDGRYIYFASNRSQRLLIIDSATYEYEEVRYPGGARGCLCVLAHPSRPLLYMGIQRGGKIEGRSYEGGNSFLATFDLSAGEYVGSLHLAEIENGRSDDSAPICLTYDEGDGCVFVGMFQSRRGICRVDELGRTILAEFPFRPSTRNTHFSWVDPIAQALYRDKLVSVNRNNRELVVLNKRSGIVESVAFLGEAPNGPRDVVVIGDKAIVAYPERQGLIFQALDDA